MNRLNRKGCQLWVIQRNYEKFSKFSFNLQHSLKQIKLEGIFIVCCLLKSKSTYDHFEARGRLNFFCAKLFLLNQEELMYIKNTNMKIKSEKCCYL